MSEDNAIHYKKLVEECKRGSTEAQRELYECLFRMMYVVAYRYLKRREEAKDAVQDSFVKIFDKLEGYSFSGSFEGWVRKIVTNQCLDMIKKRKLDQVEIDKADHEWLPAPEDDEIRWNETLFAESKRVMEALDKLPEGYRINFCLYVIEGYKHKEIAEMLNISTGTSKSNCSRAKKLLLKELKAFEYK